MNPFIVLLALVLVIVVFTYGVARALLHVWLDHRLRLALLRQYEANPELFPASVEARDLLAQQEQVSKEAQRQDYRITGVMVAALGLICVGWAYRIGLGTLAVGLYTGGVVCIILGVLIGLLGVLIRALNKHTMGVGPGHKPV